MGLFSSKKKTYVYTSVSRMVEDEDIVSSNKMAVLDYTMSQDSASTKTSSESLSDYLIRATTNNIVARARKSRNIAKKPTYSYGLPTTNLISSDGVDIKGAIQDVLESIYPEGVLVHDSYFGPLNNFYFLKPLLQEKYGYDMNTNELVEESRRIGFKCYMESAVIKYSHYTTDALIDAESVKQVGLSAEAGYTPFRPFNPSAPQVPWVNDYAGDYDIADIRVVYADAHGTRHTYNLTLDYLDYEPSSKPIEDGLDSSDTGNIDPEAEAPEIEDTLENADYFHANYDYTEGGINKRGVFIYLYGSRLNSKLDNLFTVKEGFGSYIPRMYARRNGKPCNSADLKDTPDYKSMVMLGNAVQLNWVNWVDEIHKSVGSLKDVSQIYMTYSVPANTNDPLLQDYLYEYFLGLYNHIPNRFATTAFKDFHKSMVSYGSKQGQAIDVRDRAYTNRMTFTGIGYLDILGSIGKVGSVTSGRAQMRISADSGLGRSSGLVGRSKASYHYFIKQITPNVYREVRVFNLSSIEKVKGGKTTVASGDDDSLLIPLDLAVDHEFNNRQLEEIYSKSMHMVIHTVKVVKQKWYQTGIFKAIMFVVAVVVSYFFPPAGAAMYGWMAALYAVAQTIVISIVVQLATKLLVNLGIDVGFAAAVVAVVALFYGGYTALTKTTGVAGVTTQQLMSISSQAFSMSNQGFALQTQNAIKEFNSLMADLSKEEKELQDRAKELGMGATGPLLMFEPPMSIGVRIGESPDDYYDRSIRVTNVASTIYSMTERSFDLALALPTTQTVLENMQENINELSISRV